MLWTSQNAMKPRIQGVLTPVNTRFHGVRQQADAVWASEQVVLLGRKRLLCLGVPLHVSGAPGSNGGTRGRPGLVPTSAGRRHAQADFAQADFATYWFPCAWWGRCALWDRRAGFAAP
jgi:hypothetical protein